VLTGMQALRNRGNAKVFTTAPEPLPPAAGSVLDRIRERRTIRVGYFGDSLPYVFTNRQGQLVGFDVEMALQLAHDLDVALELVPVDRSILTKGLDASSCDLVMSGAAVTAERALHVLFTSPYLDETLALIVPDHRRSAFASWDDIRELRPLRVAVPDEPLFVKTIRTELPGADVVPFTNAESVFERRDVPVDAIVLTAERGSAYTLLHPEFSVVVPKPRTFKVPLAYVIAAHDQPLATTVNTWIDLKRKDGTIDELFAHWILGQDSTPRQPRWSVIRDVLHWAR
jgi:ABC-type amino acid transport substrate-binding protein